MVYTNYLWCFLGWFMALFYPHDMAVSKNGGYNKNAHFHGPFIGIFRVQVCLKHLLYQCALQLGFRASRFASQLYQVDCGWKRHKCPPKLSTSLTNFMVTAPCTVTLNWLRKKWTNCINPYISLVKKDQWLPDASCKISREWVSVHIMRSAFKLPGLVQKRGEFPPGLRE